MHFLDKTFGRTGNRMFQMAALYKYAKMNGTDFYFQDPKWFEGCEEEIKHLFGGGIGFIDKVGVHIRRGDYVNNPFYTDLTKTDYYQKAFKMFPNERFLISSDDLNWCRDYFCNVDVDYSEAQGDEAALKELASCKHQIIANSSFSWWAAYLNPNPNKIVIAPSAWYADGVERTVCPPSWVRL